MRHKYLYTLLLVCLFYNVSAQEYKKFRVGFGLARNLTHSNSSFFYIEPAYLITPSFNIAFRFEFIKTSFDIQSTSNTQGTLSSSDILAYTANVQHYFWINKKLRSYVGLGAGIYVMYIDNGSFVTHGKTSTVNSGDLLYYSTKPGAYPTIGIEWWHLNVALEYKIIPATKIDVVNSSTKSNEIKNSYLFLKFGFFLGGGRRGF